MSYEGYDQILCKNGHLFEYDCYVSPIDCHESVWHCPICNEGMAWWNSIDQTNGVDEETNLYPGQIVLEYKTQPKYEVCIHCGNSKLIEKETYIIPVDKGHKI